MVAVCIHADFAQSITVIGHADLFARCLLLRPRFSLLFAFFYPTACRVNHGTGCLAAWSKDSQYSELHAAADVVQAESKSYCSEAGRKRTVRRWWGNHGNFTRPLHRRMKQRSCGGKHWAVVKNLARLLQQLITRQRTTSALLQQRHICEQAITPNIVTSSNTAVARTTKKQLPSRQQYQYTVPSKTCATASTISISTAR